MPEFDNTNRGVLFKNDNKEKETQPDYSGNINVEGKEFSLAAWIRTSKDGSKKFLSVSVSEPREKNDNRS